MAASEQLNLYIKVTDSGGEASFKKIGTAARHMGTDIDAGSKQAVRALDAIEKNTAETVRALDRLGQAAARSDDNVKRSAGTWAAFGAATTAAAGFLSEAARAAAVSEVSQSRLEAAVDATAESYDEYAQRLDAAAQSAIKLAFDDEKAQDALSQLTQLTGSASDALDLLGLAEDLARGKGIDLATAATIVGKVAEGNTAILSRYGIVLEEGATAQEALASLQTRFAGQADAYGKTTQASLDRVKIGFDNMLESVGASTGELQVAIALLPGMSAGFTALGAAGGLAATGIQKAIPALQALRAESALASLALGPVGLVAAGIAGVVVLGELTDWFGLAGDKAQAAVVPLNDVTEALFSMAQAGSDAALIGRLQGITTEVTNLFTAISDPTYAAGLQGQLNAAAEAQSVLFGALFQAGDDPLHRTHQQQLDDYHAITDQIALLTDQLNDAKDATNDYNQSQTLLAALYQRANEPLVDQAKLLADIGAATATLVATGDFDEYNAALGRITDNFADWYGQIPAATGTLYNLDTAIESSTTATEAFAAATESAVFATDDHRRAMELRLGVFGETRDAAIADADAFAVANDKLDGLREGFVLNAQLMGEWAAAADVANQSAIDFIGNADNILQVLYDAGKGLSGSQGFIRDVIDLQQSLSALDSTYSIIIDGSDHLGQTSQKLADHYGELVGVVREANGAIWYQTSLIDDLAGRGVIGQQEYSAAVAATTQILNDNARVQDAIGKIQIDQAPYLANLNAETADYVTNLSHQDAQQQRNVLTLMDANSQQQLAALYSLATADAMGELGENGGQYVQDMVDGLRITNPLLYDYLQTSGAIDSNGVFQFDEGDAASLLSVIGDLDSTIQDLNLSIAMLTGDPFLIAAAKADILADHIRGAKDGLQLLHDLSTRPDFGAFPTVSTAYTPAPPQPGGGGSVASSPAPREGPVLQLPGEKAGAVLLTADNTAVLRTIAETRGVLHSELIDPPWTAHIDLGNRLATSATMELGRIIHTVVDPTYTAVIDGDPSGALTGTATASSALGAIDGDSATLYIYGDRSPLDNVIAGINGSILGVGYISIQGIPGPGMSAPPGSYATGGTVIPDMPHYASGGTYAMVGEAGPEMVWMSRGDQVTNAAATASRMRGRGGGGGIVNYGPVYIYPATTDVEGAFTAAFYGSNR